MKKYAFFLTDAMLNTITASLRYTSVMVEEGDPTGAKNVSKLRDTLLMQRGAAVDVDVLEETLGKAIERLRA